MQNENLILSRCRFKPRPRLPFAAVLHDTEAGHSSRPFILAFPHCIQPLGLCPHCSSAWNALPTAPGLLPLPLPWFTTAPQGSTPSLLCWSRPTSSVVSPSSLWLLSQQPLDSAVCGGQMGVNTYLPKRLACVAHGLSE